MSKINWQEQENAIELLAELNEIDSGLSNKELEFMQSLNDWDGIFTEAQYEYLQIVYEGHC